MKKRFDISNYLVVGPENTKGRPVHHIIKEAVGAGFTCVQIRSKLASAKDMIDLTRSASQVIAESDRPDKVALLVDDRLDVVLAARKYGIKVDGIHVGQSDIPVDVCREYLGEDSIIGVSARTIDMLDYVTTIDAGLIDYLGVGPLRETRTKPDCGMGPDGKVRTMDLDEISALAQMSPVPVVVGGGVKLSDVPGLARTGVDGFFVVSAVTEADDPGLEAKKLVEAWRSNKINRSRIPRLA